MAASKSPPTRRQQILEALANHLERAPGQRITTARLAQEVGVSEAALYRHFPSKARMFEGLIEFAEDSVFGLINKILSEESSPVARTDRIIRMLFGFAQRNPGIARLLHGDILTGEDARLRTRVAQFYDRLEVQFRQVMREGGLAAGAAQPSAEAGVIAGLCLAVLQGRLDQFVRSDFQRLPLSDWDEQWPLLEAALFRAS